MARRHNTETASRSRGGKALCDSALRVIRNAATKDILSGSWPPASAASTIRMRIA